MNADKKFIIGTILTTIILLVGAVIWASSQSPRITPETTIAPDLLVSDRGYNTQGNPQAPVTLVEFSDPQCPACAAASADVKTILQEYGPQVRLVYRHFPLPMHPQAIPASHAIEAAGKQGKFFPMLESIFANQTRLAEGDKLYEEIAISLELNMDQFNADRNSDEIAAIVKQDDDDATQIGVSSTPSFFINGQLVPFDPTKTRLETLREVINNALQSATPFVPVATDSAQESTPASN